MRLSPMQLYHIFSLYSLMQLPPSLSSNTSSIISLYVRHWQLSIS